MSDDADARANGPGYGRALVLAAALACAPGLLVAGVLASAGGLAAELRWTLVIAAAIATALALRRVHRDATRPLQTLANLLGGLRRGDYSMRAARARDDDPLGVVLLETNALATTLREQRLDALEATALLRKVMSEIDVAVFTFDEAGALGLINRAGERLLGDHRERVEGRSATELGLAELLDGGSPRIVDLSFAGASGRGELRRGSFRQGGRRHVLLVVSDLSRALRQEELLAWRRLVRVLSHEINNSLAPIASVADSLRRMLERTEGADAEWREDALDGLTMIEGRAQSLGRFMRAYARLARLPPPTRTDVDLAALVRRVAALETRREVAIQDGPKLALAADPDQLEQLLINLIRNAVDALEPGEPGEASEGSVEVGWVREGGEVVIEVRDDGPGLATTANLFVPFFSTKPGGSGIGLALSRQIAEGHGGSVELRNRRDVGSGVVAIVRLPLAMPE